VECLGTVGCFPWLGLAFNDSDNMMLASALILLDSAAIAVSDVVIDSLVVEKSRDVSVADSVDENDCLSTAGWMEESMHVTVKTPSELFGIKTK